jgi:protein-disulfide isomerase
MSNTKDTKEMSKRQTRREQIRRKEQRGRIIGISLISLGAILVAFLIIYPNFKPVGDITVPEARTRPNVKFNSAGNPEAPIKIDEYSDFQCPYCRNFSENTEGQLMDTFVKDGTVYFTYHSFGEFVGAESVAAAEAAYCAGDQNKFWEMHDIIFANQTGENVGAYTTPRLNAFAEKIGLDMGTFKSCFSGKNYAKLITQDGVDGQADKIQATPSFILSYTLNGERKTKLIEGAQSYDVFKQEIQAALTALGK